MVTRDYIAKAMANSKNLPDNRLQILDQVFEYIESKINTDKEANLVFICTHNSRRSHLAQVWAATAAAYFNIPGVKTFSGGTEATEFNRNAIEALRRAGFEVSSPEGKNPVYEVKYFDGHDSIRCFSKLFDDPVNPEAGFAAIMTCSDADENCPFIPGAEKRIALTYQDPKEADNTPKVREVYDERAFQIATEMLYIFNKL